MGSKSLIFTPRAMYGKLNYQEGHALDAVIQIEAPKMPDVDRPPLDLNACIDVSGSMRGEKLQMVKQSLYKLIEHLGDNDRLSVVTFSTEVRVIARPKAMTAKRKEELRERIRRLSDESMTNFSGGMVASLDSMRKADPDPKALRRVLMFTDGLANQGVSDIPGILSLAEAQRIAGVSITTLGYGTNHNPELLQALAAQEGGNFYYAENPDKILTAFANELGGLISTAAQQVKIHLTPAKGVVIREVYNDITVTPGDKGAVTIEVGDVLAEAEVFVAIGMDIEKRSKALPRKTAILKGKVEYLDVASKKMASKDLSLKVHFVKPADADSEPDKLTREHVMIQKSAKAEAEARVHAERGDYGAAQGVMMAFAAAAEERGLQDLAEDMRGSSQLYASQAAYDIGGGRQKGLSRRAAKARYKPAGGGQMKGVKIGTSAQASMVRSFKAGSSASGGDAGPLIKNLAEDVDGDEGKKSKSKKSPVSQTGQRRRSW